MAWAKNGTPNTLGSTGDDIDITDLGGKKFNQILYHHLNSGNAGGLLTFNDDGTTNYARRYSYNGGEGTSINQSAIAYYANGDVPEFTVSYVVGISTEEKLMISFNVEQKTAGAGNAPSRFELVAKWADTSNTLDRIDIHNTLSGSFDISSNLSVLGTD